MEKVNVFICTYPFPYISHTLVMQFEYATRIATCRSPNVKQMHTFWC